MNKIKKLIMAGVFGLVLMGVAATPVSAKAKKASKPNSYIRANKIDIK